MADDSAAPDAGRVERGMLLNNGLAILTAGIANARRRGAGAVTVDMSVASAEAVAIALADAEAAEPRWRLITDMPLADTEGDVWNDHGDGLAGRIADCLFDGVQWVYQPYPFGEWEPITNPIAWMPKPKGPAAAATAGRDGDGGER